MSVFVRIDKTTITKHIRQRTNNIMRNRPVTALLQEKGRVTYGHSGKNLDWRVKYRRNSLQTYGDGQAVTFPRINRDQVAVLPWGGYIVTESVTKREKLSNRNQEAIVRIVADKTESMLDDLKEGFEDKLFVNLDDDPEGLAGFDSCLGITGTAKYTQPSDTYAGLSTVLGNYGGSIISGTWPAGQFDPQYDFWSPLVVNYVADWSATTDNWANNAQEVVRAGITHAGKNKSQDGQMDLIMTNLEMYRLFKEAVDDKERINVQRDGQASGLVALGFRDVINYDGVDVSGNYSVPDTKAYGLNIDSMELMSMQNQLFVPGQDYDITHLADQYTLDFVGQLKLNPRDLVLWDNIT